MTARNKQALRILIVEDDPSIRFGLELNLRREGYEPLTATDGEEGLRLALQPDIDLIILDLVLPQMHGLEVLQTLRDEEIETPVIILSALGQESDKVRGLEIGADDYLTKPFGLAELLARVGANLRRSRRSASAPLQLGSFRVERSARLAYFQEKLLDLTPKEFDLLLFFLSHPRQALSRQLILQRVWGYDYEGTERTVDNFVAALRRKVEPQPERPCHLLTVRGVGYRLEPSPS